MWTIDRQRKRERVLCLYVREKSVFCGFVGCQLGICFAVCILDEEILTLYLGPARFPRKIYGLVLDRPYHNRLCIMYLGFDFTWLFAEFISTWYQYHKECPLNYSFK